MLPTAKPLRADAVYEQIVDMATDVLNKAEVLKRQIAGGCDPLTLVMFHRAMRRARASGMALASAPGLVEYAQQATKNPAYDIHAGFASVLDTGAAVTDWIVENLPNDGKNGFVTLRIVDGDVVNVAIEASDLAPLGDLLDALIASIRGG